MSENIIDRIILISPLPPPEGGLSSWTKDYLTYAKEKSVKVDLIDTSLIGKDAIFHEKRTVFSELRRIHKIRKETRKHKRHKGNIVIHYNTSCSYLGLLRDYYTCLKSLKKYKIVMQCHCDVCKQIHSKRHLKMFKKVSNLCSMILVLNQQSLDYLHCNGIKVTSCYFPNFIKVSAIYPKMTPVSSIKNCVYVGHVRKEKGFESVLFCARRYPKITFHIFGQLPCNFNKPAISNLIFYGPLEKNELFEKLKQMDVLLAPSYSEGFSISLLECLATGLLVITSPAGNAASLLKGTMNIVTKDYCANSFSAAIESLLSYDKSLLKSTSKSNIVLGNKYDIYSVLENLFALYQKI